MAIRTSGVHADAALAGQDHRLRADQTWQPRRLGFVMEQVLGHTTHYRTLRQSLERETDVSPHWVEVTYDGDGRLEQQRWIPGAVRSTLRGFLQVRDGLRGRPLDALLFHTQKPAVFQWDLMTRIPTVLSLDVTPIQYDALGEAYGHTPDGETAVAWIKHRINVRTFALAKRIVAWSNWNKASLIADYGVPEDKVLVIPPGVNRDLWSRSPDGRTPCEKPRVLFVGGDFNRKGGHLLLAWFRARGRNLCELDLVTRADIWPEPGVRVFRNIVGNSPEARQLFFEADVFVLPSLAECFGIASVEAMAAGLPVITTRVGGSEDIVDDGQTGYLIEPNDVHGLGATLERLLGDVALRRQMGAQGRARARWHFDAASNARALVAVLRAAASSPRADRLAVSS